jgi:hypothetical protein
MPAAPLPSTSADDGVPSTDLTSEPLQPRSNRQIRSRSLDSRRRRIALVALILIVVVAPIVFLLTRRSAKPTRSAPSPTSTSTSSARPQFAFAAPALVVEPLGRTKASKDTKVVAAQIQTDLSHFYDQAFVDPKTWANGVPASVWAPFAPGVKAKAEADAGSLTIGDLRVKLASLSVTRASLTVTLLIDPTGHLVAATADVSFVATGALFGGERVTVKNHNNFLYRKVGGGWVIVAYPLASTRVDAAPVAPSPSASGASP